MTALDMYFIFLLAISQVSLNPHMHTTFTMVSIDFNESLSTDAPCEIEKKEPCSTSPPLIHGFKGFSH